MEVFHAYTPALLCFWLLLVPFFAGAACSRFLPESERTVGTFWLVGLLLSFVIFEPIAVVCMLRIVYESFSVCTAVYAAVMLALAAAGLMRTAAAAAGRRKEGWRAMLFAALPGHRPERMADLFYPRRDRTGVRGQISRSEALYLAVFLILLAAQLVLAVVCAPFDGDDAYYVVETLQAQQTDTIHTLIPYIGYSTKLDFRHALAEYTIWIAFIARMCGIHATILSHTVLPLFWIPLSYYVYARCGRVLFKQRRDLLPLFLSLLCLFMMFGNVSIYTSETFFLMRTWQGKSMIANFVLPLLFLSLLYLAEQERDAARQPLGRRERLFPWLLLFLTNASAGFFSTSGILLAAMLVAGGIVLVAAFCCRGSAVHRLSLLFWAGLSCVPSGALAVAGLVLRAS